MYSNAWRTTSEEKRYNERVAMEDPEDSYNNIRRAAEVHRQVRRHARKFIQPGMKLLDIAEEIEASARALVEESGLESGIGFPTGLNINDCAAHYSPNPGDTTGKSYVFIAIWCRSLQLFVVLKQGDVLKVDFGIHVKGRILDSAFTLAWDHTYDKLLEAVKDATNTGIRVGFQLLPVWYGTEFITDCPGSGYRCPSGRISWANPRNHGIV
jgi:methionyl aminopeptidase